MLPASSAATDTEAESYFLQAGVVLDDLRPGDGSYPAIVNRDPDLPYAFFGISADPRLGIATAGPLACIGDQAGNTGPGRVYRFRLNSEKDCQGYWPRPF